MKKINIAVTHKGEDYYGIEVEGVYMEVSLAVGEALLGMIKSMRALTR